MSRTGNRLALPAQADKVCASCGAKRGNVRKGWSQITRGESVVGWTCPDCPRADEPIRRTVTGRGAVRFRVVVDATPVGAVKRRQVTRTVDTLESARQVVDDVRAEVERSGRYDRALTVDQLLAMWLEQPREDEVRAVTLEGYAAVLAPVRRHLGDVPIDDVTPRHVADLKAWLFASGGRATKASPEGRPLSARTVRGSLLHFRSALDMAVRLEMIGKNPAAGVKVAKQTRTALHDVAHWSPDELFRFRDHADGHPLAAAWRLTLCGLTRADLLGLRWSDVDLDAGTVTIRRGRVQLSMGGQRTVVDDTKSEDRKRTVPFEVLHAGTTALLRRYQLATGGRADQPVVVDAAGQPLRPERYSDLFRELSDAAGVPRIRLHAVRHSLAGWLHHEGVAPVDAAALLGHTKQVHLASYVPRGGTVGIAAAAQALQAAQRRMAGGEDAGQGTGTL